MTSSREQEDPRLTPVALRRDLVARGWSDQMLAKALRDGSLARARQGAYVDGPTWAGLDPLARHEVTTRAVIARSQVRLVASHGSAAVLHDGPDYGLDLSAVHVTRPDQRAGRAEAGVRQHRGALVEDTDDGDIADVVVRRGVEVTSPTRSGLELTTVLPLEAAVVHLNDLTHRGLTTPQRLEERYRQGMEHWPASLTTDLALRLCEPRCESVAESRFMMLAWRQGLPAPEPQLTIRDAHGRVLARLDFAWPQHGVFVEVDGLVKYIKLLRKGESASDVVVKEKQREDLIRRMTGWQCRRVTWTDLNRPVATAQMLREALFPDGAVA